ncbi:MAG: hypothetical protein V7K25_02125 [Nostoc sp.]|uniref:hypothetical protein n=1 Tax=Nostoc sp. TaxID=1180 RepID=UPI002FFA5ECC
MFNQLDEYNSQLFEQCPVGQRCLLQTQGYSVIEASDPQECIYKALSAKPDTIIIDYIFSKEADLVKTLRFEKELENVFFIMLSEQ